MTEIQTLKMCKLGEWLYIENKIFENGHLKRGEILRKRAKHNPIDLNITAEEIIQEVSLEELK